MTGYDDNYEIIEFVAIMRCLIEKLAILEVYDEYLGYICFVYFLEEDKFSNLRVFWYQKLSAEEISWWSGVISNVSYYL